MAEDNDPESKTEEPTQKRLEDARRKGDIAKSMDASSAATLAGVAGSMALFGGWLCRDLATRLLPFIDRPADFNLHGGGALGVLQIAGSAVLPALAVVLGAGIAAGVAGNVFQTGLLWSPDRLKPELSKISPLKGFKRLFGIDGLVQFLKSVIKVALVAVVAWWAMRPHWKGLEALTGLEPAAILPFAAGILRSLLLAVLAFLAAGAVLDFIWQRHRFMQRMRMSREEIKEDVKQSEGDPHLKARQRQLRMQRARRRMMQAVPKATVVITNPTHYAVALRYEQGETAAPVCVAKGLDRIALKIREVAKDANVPVIEDPPLARALYAAVEIEEAIPLEHYEAVARIIGFVMSGAHRRRHRPS